MNYNFAATKNEIVTRRVTNHKEHLKHGKEIHSVML
jgi:hypothetical protein